MTYFLCVAVPLECAEYLPVVFDRRIHQSDASQWPIGQAAQGKDRSWKVVMLQVDSGSSSLIGQAGVKRTHNNDHTGLLIAGIEALLEREECEAVVFLGHWMRGYITQETVTVQGEKRLEVSLLAEELLKLEEDVRYTVYRQRKYRCPVCGYSDLDEPPYDKYGCASFDICPCCGTEFGYHDATRSHAQLRQDWVTRGAPWFSTMPPPPDWSALEQLTAAGFAIEGKRPIE
jgi:hypothetical protein